MGFYWPIPLIYRSIYSRPFSLLISLSPIASWRGVFPLLSVAQAYAPRLTSKRDALSCHTTRGGFYVALGAFSPLRRRFPGWNSQNLSSALDPEPRVHSGAVAADYRSRKSQSEAIQLPFRHFDLDMCNGVGPVDPTCHLRDRQRSPKGLHFLLVASYTASLPHQSVDFPTMGAESHQVLMQML